MLVFGVIALVSGLRGLLLTESADAVVISDVATSCDLEACYHTATVRYDTEAGRTITAEASVSQNAAPGTAITVVFYPDNPSETTVRTGHWLLVAYGVFTLLFISTLVIYVARKNR